MEAGEYKILCNFIETIYQSNCHGFETSLLRSEIFSDNPGESNYHLVYEHIKSFTIMVRKIDVYINYKNVESPHCYQYEYKRNTYTVTVAEKGIHISYTTQSTKTAQEIWHSDVIDDALRKCLIAQIIFYGCNAPFEKAWVITPKEEVVITEKLIYGLVPDGKCVDLRYLQDEHFVAEYVMKWVRSKFESATSALYSYIFAKSKESEEEKFNYFWRSFNGIYASLAKEEEAYGTQQIVFNSEKRCIIYWMQKAKAGNFTLHSTLSNFSDNSLSHDDIDRKYRHIFHVIQNKVAKSSWTTAELYSVLENSPAYNLNTNLAQVLGLSDFIDRANPKHMVDPVTNSGLKFIISLYGYLMAEFAYTIRCNYFHANKPILLYTKLSDVDFRSFQMCNVLLEHYLDHNIVNEVIEKINMERDREMDHRIY